MYSITLDKHIPAIFPILGDTKDLSVQDLTEAIVDLWQSVIQLTAEQEQALIRNIMFAQEEFRGTCPFAFMSSPFALPTPVKIEIAPEDQPFNIEEFLDVPHEIRDPHFSYQMQTFEEEQTKGLTLAGTYRMSGVFFSTELLDQLAQAPEGLPTYVLLRENGEELSIAGEDREDVLAHGGFPPALLHVNRLVASTTTTNGNPIQVFIETQSPNIEDFIAFDTVVTDFFKILAIT